MFTRITARLRFAFRGLWLAWRTDQAFAEHLICAVAVAIAAAALRVDLVEACLLAACVFAVVAAEMFNTAIEQLAKAVDREENPQLGQALDIAAGGVLVTCFGATLVGGIIFIYRLGILVGWFTGEGPA